ncbi:hypothetical protein E4U28_005846 [Claviceps purpurea]|nr:hypothetical protein E4U28_005846 [Claviceps purpurea]
MPAIVSGARNFGNDSEMMEEPSHESSNLACFSPVLIITRLSSTVFESGTASPAADTPTSKKHKPAGSKKPKPERKGKTGGK